MILSAYDFAATPLAVVELPVRVPFGFHGDWVSDPAVNYSTGAATPISRNEERPEARRQASADVITAMASLPCCFLAVPDSLIG